ncbi:MAG: Asp-tRNA(Asn)/Glu-tRNA(Gln) amidotransferase subunit GatC [Betaproteobacteria bacterium]|nr:Asp-tRNA(Asn)/Glu-tRNA(Gln) amidotransferase subunit GatC [Betaproteobacteria bacterium]MDE2622102.1 Asp-tRNA(Asn)/Glu-tRNA(Gln) amidotransferase subunit GatC [Betaproteobacteria bacterium]
MALTDTDLKRLARLARLRLEESEITGLQGQFAGILGLIDQLQAVDTRGIEPLSHALDLGLRLREDLVTETDQRARFQSVAPQVEEGLYLVPKVIE